MLKKLLYFVFLFFVYSTINSQGIYFNKRIDVSGDWDICTAIVSYDSNYFVAGNCGPGRKLFLSKISKLGSKEWHQVYPVSGYTYYIGGSGSLIKIWNKDFAITGTRVPSSALRGYGYLLITDTNGNKKWEKEYGAIDDVGFQSITGTKDSGFIITGDGFIIGSRYRYLLLKTDSLGNLQWYQTYTDNHPQRSYQGTSVVQTVDKGYCFGGGGRYNSMGNYYQIAEIIKTDNLGNFKWKKTYGNPLFLNSFMMINDAKDSCIIGSYSLGFSSAQYEDKQLYVVKLDTNGNEKWNKKIGNLEMNMCPLWIETISDKSIVIGGGHDINSFGRYVGWLFKLNKNGDSLWYREYTVIDGVNDANQLWHFTPTPDKGFAAAGSLYPNSSGGGQDIWVFKTDSMGCLVPNCDGVGISEFNTNKSEAQMLIYPNPFKEAFAINYYIPKENQSAVFKLFDIYGKLVYETGLTKEVRQLQVVAGTLKPGLYIANLVIDKVVKQSVKLVKE
jgi:hypothetical protein